MVDHDIDDLVEELIEKIKDLNSRVGELEKMEQSGGGGGGGHTIEDEGVPLPARTNLDFQGAGVQALDGGAGPDSTIVTITGNDQYAIHDNVAAEISAIANKATPVGADMAVIEDSAAANIKKMIYLQKMFVKMVHFQVTGQLGVVDQIGVLRCYNTLGRNMTIEEVEISVGTAPTGQAIVVDINKNGVTIFTNQAHRPQIAAGANVGTTTDIDVPAWNDGDYLTMDVDQTGSIVPGAYFTFMIRARVT